MISDLCDNMGANKHKILKSIGYNKIIGNKYFNPDILLEVHVFRRYESIKTSYGTK